MTRRVCREVEYVASLSTFESVEEPHAGAGIPAMGDRGPRLATLDMRGAHLSSPSQRTAGSLVAGCKWYDPAPPYDQGRLGDTRSDRRIAST